jgi:hypothetical protein
MKDGVDKWPKRGERITQNFGELIAYTSQSQWPRVLRRGVYGRSLAGIVISNTARGMDTFLFWMLYFQYRPLRRADHSSRGVLPTVVCPLGVIAKPVMGNHAPETGRSATGEEGELLCKSQVKTKRRKQELSHMGFAHLNCWDTIGSG